MKYKREQHERLLRLFDGDGYEEFHVPKYVFVKQWNGNTKRWQVAIYPRENWGNHKTYKAGLSAQNQLNERMNFLLDKED